MKSIYSLLLITLFLGVGTAQSQNPALRGIYVDKFSQILGNTVKEDSLLKYAQDSSFNYLALYDLHNVNFSNSTSLNTLAAFIRKARNNYGVQYIGAVGESYSTFLSKIAPYNNGRADANERFNVFNLEFEFWITSSVNPGAYYCTQYLAPNGCSCDTAGAFKFYIDQVHKIDSLAAVQSALSETYVGWFNQGQGQQLAANVDRILVHAYRTDASSVFGYSKSRLGYLASLNQQVNVVPIFSSEPVFMGPWLNSHSLSEPYSKYQSDFNADNSSWKPYINLLGYQWFDYGYMPKPAPGAPGSGTPVITASGPVSFCNGGSVTLSASSGSAYQWSNGATTQSITVNTTGSYTCQVTQNGSTQSTSAIQVSVNANPTSSFAIASSVAGSVVLNSTSSAGSGSISSYQWYFNNNAIGSASGSTYTASSNGDYSLRITNSNGCSATSSAQTISIPAAGGSCQLTVPGGCASINISSTSVMVSWNNLPTCDSVIIRYKKEGTNTYNYIRLAYNGNNACTITGVVPNSRYSWKVKTACGSDYSDYSTKKYFTTQNAQVSMAYAPQIRTVRVPVDTEEGIKEFTVYPNPAKEQVSLKFHSDFDQQAELVMSDISGRSLYHREVSITEGDNTLFINTSEFPSGIYFTTIRSSSINLMKRILIQN